MKKIIICVVCVLLVLSIIGAIAILPKAVDGTHIAKLLSPLIAADNIAMDVDVNISVSGKEMDIHTTLSFYSKEEKNYLVVGKDEESIYIIDDVLYMQNGAAFLIQDETEEVQIKGIDIKMFAQIAALYEALEIETEKEENTEIYRILVSGEDAQTLLSHVMPDIYEEMSQIDSLTVELTAKEDVLTSVSYSGGAVVNGKPMSVNVCVDEFKQLDESIFELPDAVEEAMLNVDKSSLFCITKDLYRLMLAFADLASREDVNGKLIVSASGGMLNFKKTYDLTEVITGSTDLKKNKDIEGLPDMLALLCMEGDIDCVEEADGFHYTLKLNKNTMEDITKMFLSENISAFIKMSKGYVEIVVNVNKIDSMQIGITGTIQTLFSKVQSQVGVEFIFE